MERHSLDLLVSLFASGVRYTAKSVNHNCTMLTATNSAEVFPTALRQVALVFTTCTQWLGQFIIAYSTPHMINDIQFG